MYAIEKYFLFPMAALSAIVQQNYLHRTTIFICFAGITAKGVLFVEQDHRRRSLRDQKKF